MKPVLFCDHSSIMFSPPLKPDPRALLVRGREDERPRVAHKAQVEGTCWFHAANFVRMRIGKDSPGFEQEREHEKFYSDFRKKKIIFDRKCRYFNCMGGSLQEKLGSIPYSRELFNFAADREWECRSFLATHGSHTEAFMTTDLSVQMNVLNNFMNEQMLSDFNLYPCSWTPESIPEELVRSLKSLGPLYVRGCFGRGFYDSEPIEIEWQDGHSILGWNVPHIGDTLGTQHSICVIGADAVDGSVYFLDPNDTGGPENPQMIYRIPYDLFTKNVRDSFGCHPDNILNQDFAYFYDGWLNEFEWSTEPMSILGLFFQAIFTPGEAGDLAMYFKDLRAQDQELVWRQLGKIAGVDDANAVPFAQANLFKCHYLTKQAVRKAIVTKYESLEEATKLAVFRQFCRVENEWIENPNAFEAIDFIARQNLVRLADAMHVVEENISQNI